VDLAYTRAMPNMTVIQPADFEEAVQATKALSKHFGPAYLRLGRPKLKGIYDSSYRFEIGKASIVKQGCDVVVFATGGLVQESLIAADILQKESISTTIVNISTLKPLDEALIINETKRHNAVIVAEDHNVIGGLNDAVCQTLVKHQISVPFKSIAVRDQFAETGSGPELYDKYGLSANHIIKAIKDLLTLKKD